MKWDAQTILTWLTIGSLVLGAIVGVARWLAHKFEESDKKNDDNLREARRIKRDLFGEDPDGGPHQTPLREMMVEVLNNTRGTIERVANLEERLGKVEREREQDRTLLINHITGDKHN